MFTDRSKRVFNEAMSLAKRHNCLINANFLLYGLAQEKGGIAGSILRSYGITADVLRNLFEDVSYVQDNMQDYVAVIDAAINDSISRNHTVIGTEHLLAGILKTKNSAASVIEKMISPNYYSLQDLLDEIDIYLGYSPSEKEKEERARKARVNLEIALKKELEASITNIKVNDSLKLEGESEIDAVVRLAVQNVWKSLNFKY